MSFVSEVIKNMGLRKKKWFVYILAEITILARWNLLEWTETGGMERNVMKLRMRWNRLVICIG